MTTPTITPYLKDGIELDQIIVQGIRVTGFHGVYAREKESGQLFLADVVAHVSTRTAADRDELGRTVNYSDIADRAAEVLGGDPADLLETVAEHIARAILEMPGVQAVDVIVHKPQAPLHVEFRDVMVKIRRDLRSGTLWADKRIGSSAGGFADPLAPAPRSTDPGDAQPLQPVTAYLGLGGNIGDVEASFREALWELHRIPGIEVTGASSLFRTRPVGGTEQADFLNAVVQLETALAPRALLAACQGIEVLHGRERLIPNGPRTLDVDLLAFGDLELESEDLEVPHPRAAERAFVLQPWATLAPDFVLPGFGRIGDLAAAVGSDGVELVEERWPALQRKASSQE
ncbi:2-amino-4-hydroxy-6-hydroxymethyldihydropteridine diphosphokinase [Demequina mangrovi]|uniref:Bifunctional folate synthesis protein n=1 Tax=Demequina mangrovi TaxID=1043493 RepID=A0A1H6YQ81_9MICO|nr:2-amino-4-hydroxy-6-hydroxymethyldihydropteridine diphosphokinase [Demequina mangrovi]SEJ39480.1 dihydroneopterin aldolase / 2-amino-4-hydroxy-6-hydroxymethyldihydropteridine diphosphokinase [Demequina mangrovi]